MEQHPVPQNVTGFEFKLVGDMTLKQFGYLAAGCIIAYLLFKATLIPFIFRIPFATFSALLGVALAFLPIEERPLDRWIIAFFSRVYQPTHYIWKKTMSVPEPLLLLSHDSYVPKPPQPVVVQMSTPTATPLNSFLATMHTPQPKADRPLGETEEQAFLSKISTFFMNEPSVAPAVRPRVLMQTQTIADTPSPKQPVAPDPMEQKNTDLTNRIGQLQKELSSKTLSKERFMELQKELTSLLTEKENMLSEMVHLRKQLEDKQQSDAVKPTEYATGPQTSTIKIITPGVAPHKGLPRLTSFPNVITGIVKTAEGDLLPNILVTVKDHEEMPVRALKTNKLGQFAASNPVNSGTYHIEIEDPQKRYQFEIVEITPSGEVIPPLEIWAKSKRDLQRQILHEELFGKKEM